MTLPVARIVHALLLACAVSTAATAALAQSPADLKRARAQFQRGIELEQASNWTEAIQQFREVGQVRMTPQVRFHIAYCEEGLGRLVTALGGYDLALAEADTVGPDFKSEVETAMARLRERIPKLFIERGVGADAALVQLDGIDVGASSIGVEVPLDPGPHSVTAAAPGFKPFAATVELKEREVTKVTLELEVAPKEVGPPPKERVVIVPEEKGPDRTVPYIIGGAGHRVSRRRRRFVRASPIDESGAREGLPGPQDLREVERRHVRSTEALQRCGIRSRQVSASPQSERPSCSSSRRKSRRKNRRSRKASFLRVDSIVPSVTPNGSFGGAIFGSF